MRITKVLVPVDFSPPSTVAVNHAVLLARRFRASLSLLHVIEPSTALMYTFPTESEAAEKQRCERAERMLAAMLGPEDQDDLDLETAVVVGDIPSTIELAVREQHADMVVMGTHGRGLFGRWLIGSVAQSLLRKIDVPILTVCHASRPLSFKRILFATDFSEGSAQGSRVHHGSRSHAECGACRHPRYRQAASGHLRNSRNDGRLRCRTEAGLWRNRGTHSSRSKRKQGARKVRVETILSEGIPADAISRIADENTVDFIVLAVSRKSRMDRILLGTTAEKVIRDANVPVLSIPVRTHGRKE